MQHKLGTGYAMRSEFLSKIMPQTMKLLTMMIMNWVDEAVCAYLCPSEGYMLLCLAKRAMR